MILTILFWYMMISYLVGFIIFTIEVSRAIKDDNYHLVGFGMILLFMSPLTAWHGVLHYVAVWWCRMNNKPFKPWI